MIAAAARLQASIMSLEAQIAVQREALAQLAFGWQGDAATAALARAEKNLQQNPHTVDPGNGNPLTDNTWRARCLATGTPGSAAGQGETDRGNPASRPLADPTSVPYPYGPTHPSNNKPYCRIHHQTITFELAERGYVETYSCMPGGRITHRTAPRDV